MKRLKPSVVIAICAVPFILACISSQSFAVGPDKTLTWQGGGQGQVVFEGKKHAKEGYGCKDCHPGVFSMKQGTASMTMAAMDKGGFCGVCHNGRTAFATDNPRKCHECHQQNRKHDKHKGHEGDKKHHGEEH